MFLLSMLVDYQVGHDVHHPNNRHCQCASCNHPCAHICKTRKPKGKRWTEDMAHMCHFSSKPHAHMCCGGEDLPSAAQPIIEPGVSWKHSNVIASLRTVPTELHPRRKSVTINRAKRDKNVAADFKKSPQQHPPHHQHPALHSPSYNIRDNCNSALLERTGSDISISSLPSSSSVAEVYVGRSVLTDESDIDSETERSLDSNSKASNNNKQGLRSLVACFIANSLRLRKFDKEKKNHFNSNRNRASKRTKKSSRLEKDKFRSKQHRPIGLSSTEGSSYADIPSSVHNSQHLPSLSLDTSSRHVNESINKPPTVTFPSSISSNHNVIKETRIKRNSFFRKDNISQTHYINEHISEEVTYSSNSSGPRVSSFELADSRPSTNASTDNAVSPRRRRHKGPAPKPPITTQCSCSPLSTTNNMSTSCSFSVPQSPTNSSMVTSLSASSHNQVSVTRSPTLLPPHLTRSLSEQKTLNMKNIIEALPTFRSEVNLQNMTNRNSEPSQRIFDDFLESKENEESIVLLYNERCPTTKLISKNKQTQMIDPLTQDNNNFTNNNQYSIYQMPFPIRTIIDEIPPDLPIKTFNHMKIFGCTYNNETKKLEKKNNIDCIPRSQSMPFSCCQHHWKEYLNSVAKSGHIIKPDYSHCHMTNSTQHHHHPIKLCYTPKCDHKCFVLSNLEASACENDAEQECFFSSDLMNALLSPQHSFRCNQHKKQNVSNKLNSAYSPKSVCNVFEHNEFIRALSDGSLTNTSAATIIEYINDDSSNGDDSNKPINSETVINEATKANVSNLMDSIPNEKDVSDVFCQTNFDETFERPSPHRYKNHKCRYRHVGKQRNHRHCQQQRHNCADMHHSACCCAAQMVTYFGAEDVRTSKNFAWLTSSTSDHSLSSLSSSTSTLSEASTFRTSSSVSNETHVNHVKPLLHQCTSSMSPFGETHSHFNSVDHQSFYSGVDTPGRSPISSEKLFKSAENNFQSLVNPEVQNGKFIAFKSLQSKF